MDTETPYYNQSYTREDIDGILETIKNCIRNEWYTISMNNSRQENQDFRDEYNLTKSKYERILLEISSDDFCHSLQNIHKGFEHEVLYVFVLRVVLYNICGEEGAVDIYIKFNIITAANHPYVIVISFHQLNKDIEYAFCEC